MVLLLLLSLLLLLLLFEGMKGLVEELAFGKRLNWEQDVAEEKARTGRRMKEAKKEE